MIIGQENDSAGHQEHKGTSEQEQNDEPFQILFFHVSAIFFFGSVAPSDSGAAGRNILFRGDIFMKNDFWMKMK